MNYKIFLFLLFFVVGSRVNAQSDLAFYCDVMNNAYEPEHRLRAATAFETVFLEELNKKGSFNRVFEELKWVSIKVPSDSLFRIVTWPIKGENDNFTYKGIIQTKDEKLFLLNDQSHNMADAEYMQNDPSFWYGALYYNLLEKSVNGDKHYFLFGYNGVNADIQIKVIDELHFEDGKPLFGSESFRIVEEDEQEIFKNRIIIDYSDKANVNCNYNEAMEMIVHDFVTPRLGISGTGRPVKIPDGTYVGYKWEGKYWDRIEKIAHQISTPESIYYQPKVKDERDLFGKPKSKE